MPVSVGDKVREVLTGEVSADGEEFAEVAVEHGVKNIVGDIFGKRNSSSLASNILMAHAVALTTNSPVNGRGQVTGGTSHQVNCCE